MGKTYLDVPLAAVLGVVILVVLLDGHVGQVDERVVHLAHRGVVLGIAEPAGKIEAVGVIQYTQQQHYSNSSLPGEAVHVLVGLERPVARHQHVDAQVELLPACNNTAAQQVRIRGAPAVT